MKSFIDKFRTSILGYSEFDIALSDQINSINRRLSTIKSEINVKNGSINLLSKAVKSLTDEGATLAKELKELKKLQKK